MDLKQRKLNKSEWDSIEIKVSASEMEVLDLIMKGYHDVTIRINKHNSIFTYLKIEFSEKMEDYIYNKFLKSRVEQIEKLLLELDPSYKVMKIDVNVKPNSSDRIRLERFNEETIKNHDIYEYLLMTHMEKLLTALKKSSKSKNKLFRSFLYSVYRRTIRKRKKIYF